MFKLCAKLRLSRLCSQAWLEQRAFVVSAFQLVHYQYATGLQLPRRPQELTSSLSRVSLFLSTSTLDGPARKAPFYAGNFHYQRGELILEESTHHLTAMQARTVVRSTMHEANMATHPNTALSESHTVTTVYISIMPVHGWP